MIKVKPEEFAGVFDKSIDSIMSDIEFLVAEEITLKKEYGEDGEDLSFKELLAKISSKLEEVQKRYQKLTIIKQSDVADWNSVIIRDFISQIKAKGLYYKYIIGNINQTKAIKKIKKKGGLNEDEIDRLSFNLRVDTVNIGIANYLNDRINKANAKIEIFFRFIKKDLRNINEIENLILNQPIDTKKVEKLINNTHLDSGIKEMLLRKGTEYIAVKNTEYENKLAQEKMAKLQKEELEKLKQVEEDSIKEDIEKNKKFNINNYEAVETILEKYSDFFPSILMTLNIEELLTSDELKEVLKFNFIDVDDEVFSHAFMTLLSKIDKTNNEDSIKTLLGYLEILCIKYELYNKVIGTHNEIRKVFSIPNLTAEEVEILSNIKTQLLNIYKESDYDNVNTLLDKMHLTLYNIKNTNKTIENKKIEIKAFTLFDYKKEDGINHSYVITDLDANSSKNFIDDSLDKNSKLTNSYIDFNELIDDILIYGESKLSLEANDKLRKVVRPVYYSDGPRKIITPKMSNATGIYRIRPRMTSNLRFFEEKIVFLPGSEKYNQIISLLESKLPNSIIDNTNQFAIYINYLDAVKQKDTDSYNIAKKRQSSSELRNVLRSETELFTEEELAILSDSIDSTLKTFQELTELNDSFEFNTINHLKGGNPKLN